MSAETRFKFKFSVQLGNGSNYTVEARDGKEAYEIATEQEIESLRKEFVHHQKNGTYNALKIHQAPILEKESV